MPSYDSLSTQITAVKNEIDASLTASNYSAQDLVFVAKALETLGSMLGVNDIVAATAANVTTINSTGTTNVNLVNTGGTFYYTTSSAPSTGTWYHLVHTYNGTTQYLYINGVLTTTFNSSASGNISYDTNNTLLAIGADFNGSGYNVGPTGYVNGKMPVARIYNIAQNYVRSGRLLNILEKRKPAEVTLNRAGFL